MAKKIKAIAIMLALVAFVRAFDGPCERCMALCVCIDCPCYTDQDDD